LNDGKVLRVILHIEPELAPLPVLKPTILNIHNHRFGSSFFKQPNPAEAAPHLERVVIAAVLEQERDAHELTQGRKFRDLDADLNHPLTAKFLELQSCQGRDEQLARIVHLRILSDYPEQLVSIRVGPLARTFLGHRRVVHLPHYVEVRLKTLPEPAAVA